jgi:hypothetical protein
MKIKKNNLIEKIIANKEEHIKEYNAAVEAYKKEAVKQLKLAAKELKGGSLKIKLQLVTPVNNAEEYDKVVEMFQWEVNDEIELTQKEFNEYVHDDNDSSRSAKFSNSTYIH